jgi:O-antigen/teichoic acid export membrane protein
MDYLRLADKSSNPEIRAAAIDIAKRTSKYERKQGARVSPTLILVLNIFFAIAMALAGWYAFLRYPERLAYELTTISILLYLVLVGVSLFLPGYLSQSNFMKIIGWLVSHIKTWRGSAQKARGDGHSESDPTDSKK